MTVDPFWEEPDKVDEFASRPPDHRLVALVGAGANARGVRALDLGCAGGRNTVFLAARGADVTATDGSRAMVDRTRGRLAALVGPAEAERRVHLGPMHVLPWAENRTYDLVVALGIYHNARSAEEWHAALAETARVLRPGGLCLVSVFTPETDLEGEGKAPVPGTPHLYERPGGRLLYLVDPATLDSDMTRHGLEPVEPTLLAEGKVPVGRRVSANGLFRRRA